MLISDMHRFNIYEIRQIYSSHLKKHISAIVNSQRSKPESALLEYSKVAFVCMLFGAPVAFSSGHLKVKFEEKLGQHFGN